MRLTSEKQNIKVFISLLFVVSGIAGLIYQIVWFKYLSLFLGNTTYAQMTVLAAFLGGLAFGNYLFGKKSDALKNPVKVYSLLELFIGIYCLLYPTLSMWLGNLFLSAAGGMNISSQQILFNGLRFSIAALLLFAPTTAMGGTLPVLSKFFVEKLRDARKEIAVLYFLNSFGAVVGVVFAGFILIKEFGLNGTIYATACLNIIAGLAAFFLSIKNNSPLSETLIEEKEKSSQLIDADKQTVFAVVIVAGISGMAALLYEMVWTRLLINFFGSSTYAFSIMLMSFIGGITIGSLIVSQKFLIKYNYVKLIAFLQSAIAVSTMVVLLFYERLPYYLWKISALFSKTPEAFSIFIIVEFFLCFMLMLLPTLFMGMTLPVATEIISRSNKKVGFSVGRIFSVNTLGTVIGVIITGLLFIPFFGIKTTFEIGIALNLIAAFLILFSYKTFTKKERTVSAAALSSAFILYLFLFSSWNQTVLLSGVFKSLGKNPPETFEEFTKMFSYDKILFYQEGINATVAVTESIFNSDQKRLIINGKPDASTYYDMPTQVLLGQIPTMLHRNPKNVFVVGFGSGTTIGSVLTHPVEKVTCAEISKEVIAAAKYFEKENYSCWKDPRLHIYNEDALTLLKLSKEKYDAIISEPSNPWIAGIGNLFSQEYFKRCYDRLSDDGIMVQWFHLYSSSDDVVKLVFNTFSSVFPYAQLWGSVSNDVLLVGSKKNISVDFNNFRKNFYSEKIYKDFSRIGIRDPFTFFTCQVSSPKIFFSLSDDKLINYEIHPRLEFLAPKAFFVGETSTYLNSFDEKFDTLSNSLLVKDYVKYFPPAKEEIYSAINYHLNVSRNFRFAYGLAKYSVEKYPADYNSNLLFSNAYEKLSIRNPRKSSLEKLISLFPDSLKNLKDLANSELLEKVNASTFLHIFSIEKEAALFVKTTKPDSVSMASVFVQLGKVFLQNSEFDKALAVANKAEEYFRKSPNLLKTVSAADYYYVEAITNLCKKDYEKVFGYYLALINADRNYENIFRLRKLVQWHLKMEK